MHTPLSARETDESSSRGTTPQESSIATRLSRSLVTRLSVAGARQEERDGTVAGVVVNTLCNVMGAGVLALPLATREATVGLAALLLLYVALMSAYAVYCLVVACDVTGQFSVTGVSAFALYPTRHFPAFRRDAERAEMESSAAEARGERAGGPRPGSPFPSLPHHASAAAEDDSFCDPVSVTTLQRWRRQYAAEELYRRQCRRWVTVLVEGVVFLSNSGTLVIYSRVIADSMPPVIRTVSHQLGREPPVAAMGGEGFWLVSSGIVFFVLSCARNMDELKWTSFLGFVTIFYIVVVVAYRHHTASWSDDPAVRAKGYPSVDPEERGTIHWLGLPVTALRTISTYGVAFGYHFNVPYFYKELKVRVPGAMMKSVACAFPVIVGSYAATGLLGYLTFGNLVASKKAGGNIVANYPEKDWLVNLGRLGLFVHFACVFPIVAICTRRGMHRLCMIGLTWRAQSRRMVLAAQSDAGEEEAVTRAATTGGDERTGAARRRVSGLWSTDGASPAKESSPLLSSQARPPSFGTGGDEPDALAGGGGAVEALLDIDRDVGSPDDTTRLAIVVEAFVLVAATVVMATAVPGISFVIDIIGTLFGVFMVLIVPGVVGLCVFSTSPLTDFATIDGGGAGARQDDSPAREPGSLVDANVTRACTRHVRVKRALCWLSTISGIAFTLIGTSVFVQDHFLSGKKTPVWPSIPYFQAFV